MKVPKGNKFLPDMTVARLRTLHKKERNAKAKDRLLAYIARKNGDSVQAIGRNLDRPNTTIYDWLVRAENGLDRLHDSKRPGLPRRLTGEQLAELKEDLVAGPQAHGFKAHLWTGKMMAGHVLKKYGISYVPRTMQGLMREMGLRHAKPRSRHAKAASEKEKKGA